MRFIALAGLALLALLLLAIAPGDSASATDPQATTPTADVPSAIPAEAKRIKNPVSPTLESIEKGGLLFSSQCTMCHATDGSGSGDLALRLALTMPDFRDPARQSQRTDGELFYILTHGHGRMPGEGTRFSDATKWNLVNYIRSLAAED